MLVGSFLVAVARRILYLPVCRYVDDIFGPERAGSTEQAKLILARYMGIETLAQQPPLFVVVYG